MEGYLRKALEEGRYFVLCPSRLLACRLPRNQPTMLIAPGTNKKNSTEPLLEEIPRQQLLVLNLPSFIILTTESAE